MPSSNNTANRKAAFLAASVATIHLSTCSTLALTVGFHINTHTFRKNNISNIAPSAITINTSSRFLQQQQPQSRHTTLSLHATKDNDLDAPTPLCDLQTLLRMCDLVDSGGAAKSAIQNSECILNGNVETRRSKKLFPGDKVTFGPVIDLDVAKEVTQRGYVYKPKVKKTKPLARVDADGNLEFGGRFRSEEWRAERKQKKTDRKIMNKSK